MPATYTIKDTDNRVWGSFTVRGEREGKIYGYLNPTPEFKDVHKIFILHDEEISKDDGDTDKTINNILELGAYLIDSKSEKRIDIGGIIFINKEFLVTCELPKPK